MAFDVGAIIGRLKLDKSGWDSSVTSVKKDEKKIQGFTQRNSANFKKMGTAITVVGAAIVGSAALMIRNYVKMGDEVQKMSLRTGFATETLSELSFAAQISGADISSLEKGVKKMQKTIVDAGDGLSTYVRAFERVGLAVEDLAALSPEEQFLKIGNAIASVEDPTIRTASAMDIFGRAGTQLLPLFNEGVEGMKNLREEARRLGIVFDQEAADKAARLADAQLRLKNAFQGVGLALADSLIPIISNFVEKMAETISKITAWMKAHPGLTNVITKLTTGIGALLLGLGPIVILIPKIVLSFGKLKLALAAIGGPITAVVAGLAFIAVESAKAMKSFKGFSDTIEARAQAGGEKIGWLKKTWTSLNLTLLKFKGHGDLAQKAMRDMAIETGKLNIKNAEYGKKVVEAVKETKIYDSVLKSVSGVLGIFSKSQKDATKNAKLLEKASMKVGIEIKDLATAQKILNGELENVNGELVKVSSTLKDDLTPAIDETKEATESWLDFLNNIGFKTLKQQQERIVILQGHLENLDEEYQKGEISLEAYRIATKAVNDEIQDLSTSVIDTAVPAVRDMSGVLDQAVDDMGTKIGEFPPVVEGVMTKIVDIMDTRWGDVIKGMSSAFGQFVFDVLSTGSTFAENLAGLWGGIKDTFKNVVADMAQEWVEKFLKKVLTETFNIGASIISSLAKTAKSAVDVAGEAAAEATKSVAGTAKDVVGSIASVGSASSALLTGAGAAVGSFLGTALGSLVGKKTTGWQKAMQAIGLETADFVHDLLNETVNFLHKLEPILWNTNEIKDNTRAILEASWSISEKISNLGKQNNAIFKVLESMAKSLNAIVKGGLAEGAIVNRPTIKLIGEQAPRIPEVVQPLPDFQRMLQTAAKSGTGKGGKVEIFVSNKVDLIGQIITDDEHTRRRLIPLIMQALKTNIGMTELTDILKAKGVI